jgi:amino-acid N-acetyltransferase
MIRKANIKDVKAIYELINLFAKDDLMLPRSINDIYDNLRDFFVYQEKDAILGCCALHISWEDLAEVRSLAVGHNQQRRGIGKQLVKACLDEAKELGIKKIFTLTYVPAYFEKLGFMRVNKSYLPRKVWGECISCVKFPDCSEVPMIKEIL